MESVLQHSDVKDGWGRSGREREREGKRMGENWIGRWGVCERGRGRCCSAEHVRKSTMIESPPPSSKALLPTFRTRVLILPRIPRPTPVLYSAVPLSGICTYTEHPKPHPKTPLFQVPELESGRNELPSGQPGPQLGNIFEKWTKPAKKIFLCVRTRTPPL